jgi:hypothetical protein
MSKEVTWVPYPGKIILQPAYPIDTGGSQTNSTFCKDLIPSQMHDQSREVDSREAPYTKRLVPAFNEGKPFYGGQFFFLLEEE